MEKGRGKRPMSDSGDEDEDNKHMAILTCWLYVNIIIHRVLFECDLWRQKRIRFPKGRKIKAGDEKESVFKPSEDEIAKMREAKRASEMRSMRRNQITSDLFQGGNRGIATDIYVAEEHYEKNETFVDDGIVMEPFNLDQERKEGYFDDSGNYVEYINENEIKDAWLDSVQVDPKLAKRAGKRPMLTSDEDGESKQLSAIDVAKIKRRIADVLEPGETVLRALKRLKGNPTNRKDKMSASVKEVFDQLTEDASKLLEDGDYNVYNEKQEVFERDAGILSKDDDELDMFAGDDENDTEEPIEDATNGTDQPSANGDPANDYVYDESSGYYYSSSLRYYYDPSSSLYFSAASGQWYRYNEAVGTYDEVESVQDPATKW